MRSLKHPAKRDLEGSSGSREFEKISCRDKLPGGCKVGSLKRHHMGICWKKYCAGLMRRFPLRHICVSPLGST